MARTNPRRSPGSAEVNDLMRDISDLEKKKEYTESHLFNARQGVGNRKAEDVVVAAKKMCPRARYGSDVAQEKAVRQLLDRALGSGAGGRMMGAAKGEIARNFFEVGELPERSDLFSNDWNADGFYDDSFPDRFEEEESSLSIEHIVANALANGLIRGESTKRVQRFLNQELGLQLDDDGIPGNETQTAFERYKNKIKSKEDVVSPEKTPVATPTSSPLKKADYEAQVLEYKELLNNPPKTIAALITNVERLKKGDVDNYLIKYGPAFAKSNRDKALIISRMIGSDARENLTKQLLGTVYDSPKTLADLRLVETCLPSGKMSGYLMSHGPGLVKNNQENIKALMTRFRTPEERGMFIKKAMPDEYENPTTLEKFHFVWAYLSTGDKQAYVDKHQERLQSVEKQKQADERFANNRKILKKGGLEG